MDPDHPLASRSAGLLLHPTALPGPRGAGDLGPAAREFVDFLARADQTWWQMLPIHPPDVAASPYLARSATAGSALLIGLEGLVEEGWLAADELESRPSRARAEHDASRRLRARALARAFERFDADRRRADDALEELRERTGPWLDDWTLYAALKARHGGRAWSRWPADVRRREPGALGAARRDLAGELRFRAFLQLAFDRQWSCLRRYAAERGVSLFGDLPFFVAGDSADTWRHPELFDLDPDGRPLGVAGTPPDAFTDAGQRWGNPLYRWERHRDDGFRWWRERARVALRRFDALRLDHFLGFVRAWRIPPAARDARDGEYVPGPGRELFDALRDELGGLPFAAEDLGDVGADVEALRDELGLPGIRVLVFGAGDTDEARRHRPATLPENVVVYPATHDNDTVRGWFESLPETAPEPGRATRERARERLGLEGDDVAAALVRAALGSPANTAVVQVQDLLALGSEARTNRPGTARGNWRWRLRPGALDDGAAERLADRTRVSGRGRTPGGG